ncbi:single-stranded DNA-binding protein [Candidatus Vidania fulgoroideorum]
MKFLNKIFLIGYIGNKPNINSYNKNYIFKFSISTINQNKTIWHNITFFNKNKKIINIIRKGNLIFIEGRINYIKWKNKKGFWIYKTEILCNNLKLLHYKNKKIIYNLIPY